MRRTFRPRTARVTLRDYNWRTPFAAPDGSQTERQLQLVATAEADTATGSGLRRAYGDHFEDEAEGQLLATVRAQRLLVDRAVHEAPFWAPGLGAGHRLSTSGMPIADLDGEYVVREVALAVGDGGHGPDLEDLTDESGAGLRAAGRALAMTGDGSSAAWLSAFPAATAFRPPRRTPRPRIVGHMHAVIDGEVTGDVAHLDAHGRYKAILPFDESAASGGRASRWIRMAQPSAGANYGMHLPLHIGTEVLVSHLDGDPDRPVIVGAVPNVDTMSPVVDRNATQSRIKTSTGILFELEDDAG